MTNIKYADEIRSKKGGLGDKPEDYEKRAQTIFDYVQEKINLNDFYKNGSSGI